MLATQHDEALRQRFAEVEARSFERRLATFKGLFDDARADDSFARVGLRLAFAVLDGIAIDRMIDVDPAETTEVLDAFNVITAAFFPHSPGGT